MKNTFLLVFLSLLFGKAWGQINLDSLWNIWEDESQHDTIRIKALHSHTLEGTLYTNPDTALYFLELEFNFAKEKGQKKFMAKALNTWANAKHFLGDEREAVTLYEKALKISKEINNLHLISIVAGNVVTSYRDLGEYQKFIEYNTEALKASEVLGDKEGIAYCFVEFGTVYYDQGNLELGLDYLFRGLKVFEALNDSGGVSTVYNNLGVIYSDQEDFNSALEYYQKALEIEEKLNDPYSIAKAKNNIGTINLIQGDFELAKTNFNSAFELSKNVGIRREMAFSLDYLGQTYHQEKNYRKAEDFFMRSLKIRKETEDKRAMIETYGNLGALYGSQREYNKGIKYYNMALNLSEDIGDIMYEKLTLKESIKILKKAGRFEDATQLYDRYLDILDSINLLESNRVLSGREIQYNYEKQAAIDSLEFIALQNQKKAEQELQSARLESKTKQGYLLIGLLGLLLVFIFFVYYKLRVTRQQKNEISHQKWVIENSHNKLKDSIRYARYLQNATLPAHDDLKKFFPENFIFYKPKDVVSGDFYWFRNVQEYTYIAVADCTGHGVPGALISVVCSNALDRAVKEFGLTRPGEILNKARELVIETFTKSGGQVKDGMDITFCVFGKNSLIYSGAYNPLWIVRNVDSLSSELKTKKGTLIGDNSALIEFKADRQPVGLYTDMAEFNEYEIELFDGDCIYLFTDGFIDQFGGPKGKKFKGRQLKKLLMDMRTNSVQKQLDNIAFTFESWKGQLEQIDDVCVLGIKV